MSVRVGVVTVTFRGGDQPERWAEALRVAAGRAGPRVTLQAVAVDNDSRDGTAERLRRAAPWVDVRSLPRNAGFAAGCNAGIRVLETPDLVVLLNPDVRVAPDFLDRLGELPWPADLAARGPLVIGADGGVEQSARGFPSARTALLGRTSLAARLRPGSKLVRRELRADPRTGTGTVDWVSGACLIIRAEALARVGLLDEGYFMYWEDADWCRRAHDLGLRVEYEPSLSVRHAQGSSSASRPIAMILAFHRSAFRYWRLHVSTSAAATVGAAAALSARCAVKLAVTGVRRGGRARDGAAPAPRS